MSVGNYASDLEKTHRHRNGVNQDRSRDPMPHLPRSRRDCGYHGRATLEDKRSAEETVMLPWGEGVKGVKIHPLSDPGGTFSIRAIKYCNLSLTKSNENKQFTCFEGPMLVLQGFQGAQLRLKRTQSRAERGPSKLKWAKMHLFHFWEGATSTMRHHVISCKLLL